MKNKSALVAVFAVFFLSACTHRPPPSAIGGVADEPGRGEAVSQLESDLAGMLGYPDNEAALLARTAVEGTGRLAGRYGVHPPALFHNFLVNLGIKDRGLCCHWTEDLLAILQGLELQKYSLTWAVSRHGSLREHSSVVVTAAGRDFSSGIVLDPWRHAGTLFWSAVAADTYQWRPHPDYDGAGSVRCGEDRPRKQARLPAARLARTP